ncbi:MAG: D-tyrosyl-tRNA(Tyr) deacylase [Firmicutes bacterium]|nr:D-tyrosyl-tRNA(Tyr) deacylase [Clostridiales bacterium]MBQ4339820.1 D-tyrosyl-tRNA(Tyr) deacylase [Bacillota bacterium]
MRAVVQRVTEGSVTVEGKITGEINNGFVVLLGVGNEDTEADADYIADKVSNLRVFEDEEGKMNLSLKDVGGEILAISQFTLYGDCRKGRRPGFTEAARPEKAKALYDYFTEKLRSYDIKVGEGIFQAEMLVKIYNDGPVTLLLDSKKLF